MSDNTKIEWTDATWNPITGCTVVSAGCKHCYAMKLAGTRMRNHWSRKGLTIDTKAGPVWNGQVRFNEQWLNQPLRWKAPRMIFVCAHGDLFHESVPDVWIDRVFAVMGRARHHVFQVLTKRPKRALEYIREREERMVSAMFLPWPLPNVWLGVSVEDQAAADERIPLLLRTPAAVRFLSCEPLLGPIDLRRIKAEAHCATVDSLVEPPHGSACMTHADGYCMGDCEYRWRSRIDWVICGGESGHGARPMHPDWARSLRDQCAAAGVPYFFKQHGDCREVPKGQFPKHRAGFLARDGRHLTDVAPKETHGDFDLLAPYLDDPKYHWAWMEHVGKKAAGRLLDGREHNGMPA